MEPRSFRDPSTLNKPAAGFVVADRDVGKTEDLALLTLRRALESYCATYKTMMNRLSAFDPKSTATDKEIISSHGLDYVEAAFETIIHFQHFAEIVTKRVLADAHPLLPVSQSGSRHHVLIYDLLTTGKAPDEEVDSLHWMEFSDALERVTSLVTERRLPKDFGFIVDASVALKTVNNLRNRLLHRGRFVPKYDALDELVAGYLLPFALCATQLPAYKASTYWRPMKLHCGIDPLNEIAAQKEYDLPRVAFMKALASGAYNSPLTYSGFLFVEELDRIKSVAEHSASLEGPWGKEIRDCPVCGVKALVLHENTDSEEDEDGNTLRWWWNIFMVKCQCCGFEVNDHLDNPSAYGVKIPDFWKGQVY